MARISTYPIDSNITKNDMLLGTDLDDNSKTVNFKVDEFAAYVKGKILPYSTFAFFIDRTNAGVITVTEHMNDTGLTFAFSGATNHIDMTASASIANSKVSLISTCTNTGDLNKVSVNLLQPKYLASSGTAVSRLQPVTPWDGSAGNVISAYVEFKIYN